MAHNQASNGTSILVTHNWVCNHPARHQFKIGSFCDRSRRGGREGGGIGEIKLVMSR